MVVLQRISKFLSRIRQSAAVPGLFAVVLLVITMPGGSAPANPHELSLDMASGAARPHGEKTPTLEYEIVEGRVTLIIRGVDRTDVEDIFWDNESVMGTLGDIFDPGYKYNIVKDLRDGFTLDLGRHLSLEGSGVVEVKLTNGETLHKTLLATPMPTLEWLSAPQTASCVTATGIYNAVRCDSVTSDVGTPLYPCCDNDGDRKATGATDGNCTWYAWYKAKKVKDWTVPGTWGGAGS